MNRTNEAYRVSCSDLDALREQDLKLPRTNEAPRMRSTRDSMQGALVALTIVVSWLRMVRKSFPFLKAAVLSKIDVSELSWRHTHEAHECLRKVGLICKSCVERGLGDRLSHSQ